MAICFFSLIATFASVLVIAQLTPLKTVEPFVIQVDPKSGITQVVDPMSVRELSGMETVNNYFIVQYIRARESYDINNINQNYATVRVMSDAGDVYSQFKREVSPSNPNGITAKMGSTGSRTVRFKSIVYIKPKVAQAQVLIEESTQSGTKQYNRIITLSFDYVKLNLTTEDRYLNPIGFQVNSYRVDEDALPQ